MSAAAIDTDPQPSGHVIEFDTPFQGEDLYTRANAGEVFPRLLSPLSWSLLGLAIERGFMRCMADDFAAVEPIPGGYRACGRMAGRLHLNLSVFRTVAERVPGSSAHDLDVQYFGDAVANGLPGHPDEKVGLSTTLRCTTSALRTMATFARRVKAETRRVHAREAWRAEFLASGPDAVALLDAAVTEADVYAELFGTHVTARALTASAVSLATGALTKKGMSEDEALQLISSLPDLESAKPSKELRTLARALGTDARGLLPRGADWAELTRLRGAATGAERDAAVELHDAVTGFLAVYGHRGVNEFDPAAPVWGTDPDAVLSLLRRLLGAPDTEPAPAAAAPAGVARTLVKNARTAIHRAENTKDNVIRASHTLRLLIDAALEQLADRLTREQALALTVPELRAVAAGGDVPAATIERRLAEIEAALRLEPAEWSQGHLSVVEGAAATELSELTGLPGSQGVARGRVRILREVDDPLKEGEVLVASTTDTAWTPLFLAAAAVVTDTGGPLSHATIVARELGIPAVVNTKTASRDLRDGDLIEVDGGLGVVRLLERGV